MSIVSNAACLRRQDILLDRSIQLEQPARGSAFFGSTLGLALGGALGRILEPAINRPKTANAKIGG